MPEAEDERKKALILGSVVHIYIYTYIRVWCPRQRNVESGNVLKKERTISDDWKTERAKKPPSSQSDLPNR